MPDFAVCPSSPGVVGVATALALVAGSLVGSFLNVIVHRVPRRETVVFGRSRCPDCGSTIRARDNVPVLGWILLGGRCRECGAAISPRYPLVEAACGVLAVLLAVGELLTPHLDPLEALTAWGGRLAVALALVAWWLLAARGHTISRTTVGIAIAGAALMGVLSSDLRPLPIGCPAAAGGLRERGDLVLALLAGLASGGLGGMAVGGRPAAAAAGLVGVTCGWQAAMVATLLATVARLCRCRPATATLAAAVAVVAWRPLGWAWEALCRGGSGG